MARKTSVATGMTSGLTTKYGRRPMAGNSLADLIPFSRYDLLEVFRGHHAHVQNADPRSIDMPGAGVDPKTPTFRPRSAAMKARESALS
jgi:hypothetical protein